MVDLERYMSTLRRRAEASVLHREIIETVFAGVWSDRNILRIELFGEVAGPRAIQDACREVARIPQEWRWERFERLCLEAYLGGPVAAHQEQGQ